MLSMGVVPRVQLIRGQRLCAAGLRRAARTTHPITDLGMRQGWLLSRDVTGIVRLRLPPQSPSGCC
jgi:hypothetical protein